MSYPRLSTLVRALGLVLCAAAMLAASASAAPQWGITLTSTPSTLSRDDQRVDYTATVQNTAATGVAVGEELTCLGTPADGKNWAGNPTPTFEYQWLRSAQAIAGATGRTYTTTGADEGKPLQCVVKGTNDADGPGGTYAPNSSSFSSAPVTVAPLPPVPLSGKAEARLIGGEAVLPTGTATTTAGSNVLTDVVSVEGTGVLTAGSTIVEEVSASHGEFASGQIVVGPGIPAEDEVFQVLNGNRLELREPATGSGLVSLAAGPFPFQAGQEISGSGIPPGTKIVATSGPSQSLSGRKIALSNPATATAAGVAISATSELACEAPKDWSGTGITWTYQWLRNSESVPGATSDAYPVTPADTEPPSVLQCETIAKDAAGNEAIAISGIRQTLPRPPRPYVSPAGPFPVIATPSFSSGQATVEVELPSGSETLPFEVLGNGWSCTSQLPSGASHAKVTCTREDMLAPGDSYPPIKVVTYLGADAPDLGIATATVSGGGSPPASAEATFTRTEASGFGILPGSFEAGVFDEAGAPYTKAGGHPYRGFSTFGFNVHRGADEGIGGGAGVHPTDRVKDIVVDLPRGFQGNALATPQLCPTIEDVILATCPSQSSVGGIDVYAENASALNHSPYPASPLFPDLPIYSVEPEFGQPAQFAFSVPLGVSGVPYTFVPELRPEEGYAISFRTAPILTLPPLFGSSVDLCDFGAKLSGTGSATTFKTCRKASEPGAYPNPLITNPTRCTGPPPSTALRVNSWEHPAEVKTYDFTNEAITDCDQVLFEPQSTLVPTSRQADSPTGLEVEITMPTDGLLDPNGVGQANLDTATVTFPKGMSINPAAADGLGACTPAQIQLKTNAEAQCPESSRIGEIEIETPIIRKTLTGSIYVAKQNDNPFNAALGIYLVFSSARDGVTIKVAGKLTPDPVTGQLVSTFTENVEAPFSRIAMKFNSGPRAPLINPPKCGSYAIHVEFSPWSAVNPANPTPDEIVSQDSRYKVTQGPGGGACPGGELAPALESGLSDPTAGIKSPFGLTLSREDGSARLTGLEVTTPKGLTAYLKGIPYCPDAVLAGISSAEETGRAELNNPACPAASQVGTVLAGAGGGPSPFQTPGRVYLAGPYKGAPVSLAVVTPAVAGPFDLGNVVIRNALRVDPESAQVTAVSDPIPTILHGILLDLRQVRLALDRPNFTAAPTNCEPMTVGAKVNGEGGAVANLSNGFQVGGCKALGFKPKLSFRLFGGTQRGSHPRLRATLRARPGDANIAKASVALPHSEFLDQAHIRTVCTRVQFAADACPAGSVYGEAEATSPLVDYTLKGPVYLRSSNNQLPDMVVALRGPASQPIEIDLVGRIDSVNGGIRSTFEAVPDQPVSSFTLNMRGGKKGLLVNSRNLCNSVNKVTASFTAQSGKSLALRPKLQNSCKKAAHKGKKKSKGAKERRSPR